jgi:uncharacterized damage-inducible protein DinB
MIDVETLKHLAEYNAWADQTLFDAMNKLPEGTVYRETKTLFKSMVGTLNHNYQVDLIWQAHLTGGQHGFSSRRDILHANFADLIRAQHEINLWYVGWAAEQVPDKLSELVNFNFTSGTPVQMQKGVMFLHVINHKTYHRGWVSQMFFDFDAKPPETDLSVYMTRA